MRYNRIVKALLNYFGIDKKYLLSRKLILSDIVWHIDEVEYFLDSVEMTTSEKLIFYMFLCPRVTHKRTFNSFEDRLWVYEAERIGYNSVKQWDDGSNGEYERGPYGEKGISHK